MPLESTIVCLDVSEWMRNGDYTPSRADAQYDAAAMICGVKVDQNPENTVGVLTMGGKGVRLLTSPTEDIGKLLSCLHGLAPQGPAGFVAGIKTAMIALKHRKNKHGGQRIVAFVGSPLAGLPGGDVADLKKLGAVLKKNNIALDVVCIGENDANYDALAALVEAASANGNSHFLSVPPGTLPSDVLATSPLVLGEDAFGEGAAAAGGEGAGAGSGGGGAPPSAAGGGGASRFAEYGGIDPSLDPELAMALRISMEEARAAAAASEGGAGSSSSSGGGAPPATPASGGTSTSVPASAALAGAAPSPIAPAAPSPAAPRGDAMALDDDELLQQALALSMAEEAAAAAAAAGAAAPSPAPAPAAPAPAPAAPAGGFVDPAFAMSLLGSLEGVDVNDPAIQAALAAMQGGGAGAGGSGSGASKPPGDGGSGDKK